MRYVILIGLRVLLVADDRSCSSIARRRFRCLYPGMDKKGKDSVEEVMVELPEEIMSEILLKVPVKSLLKCKRVCKLWNNIISSPHFIKKHLKRAHATHYNHHKMSVGLHVLSSTASNRCVFYQETSDGQLRAKQFDFPYQFPADESKRRIVASVCNYCDGLICFNMHTDMHTHGVLIWNPSLPTEYKIIRTPDSGFKILKLPNTRAIAMGHDPTVDDYKIVSIPSAFYYHMSDRANCFIDVFSFKSNLWRKRNLSLDFSYSLEYPDLYGGFYTRNRMHWSATRFTRNFKQIQLIIYFDMVEERLDSVNMPSNHHHHKLLIYKDSLAAINKEGLWVLDDYCGMESLWSKVFPAEMLVLSVFCFDSYRGFVTHDTKNGSSKRTVIEGDDIAQYGNEESAYICNYVESLVSPRWCQ